MKTLTQNEMQDVNGGIFFMAIPAAMSYGVIGIEMAIIWACMD